VEVVLVLLLILLELAVVATVDPSISHHPYPS
jgi:hypothetical protein